MPSGVKRTHDEFLQMLDKKPFGKELVILTEYCGEKNKIKCQCKKCGYVFDITPKTLLSGVGCKACHNIDVFTGFNDLATVDPELASEWDYEKNDMLPTAVLAGSKKKANWICKNGHSWSSVIYDRHTKKTKCPYCSGRFPIEGVTDFASLYPQIANEWNYNKNGHFKPSDFTGKSSFMAWWICQFGHTWRAPIYSRANGIGCPQCARELQTSFPEQALLYYTHKTGTRATGQYKIGKYIVDIFLPDINTVVEYDGERWHRNKTEKDNRKNSFFSSKGYKVIRIREEGLDETENAKNFFYKPQNGGNSNLDIIITSYLDYLGFAKHTLSVDTVRDQFEIFQQYISMKKENSIENTNPELIIFWDYDKNNPVLPNMLCAGSGTVVSWKCPVCGYKFKRSINQMVRIHTCPVCVGKSGLVQQGVNDLKTINPQLSEEWVEELNCNLPSEVAYNSTQLVWWKCSLNHIWQARITDRRKGNGCPYCKNKKCATGFNDLQSKYPEIASLWDYEKNSLKPEEVVYSSKKEFFWLCKKHHSFTKSPYRLIHGEGCPYCASRKIDSGYNSLRAINPELAKEWHPMKNSPLTPEMVMPNSVKKVWWQCKNGHEWQATVANRNNRKSGCPYCSGKLRIKGHNDLATLYPNIVEEWDYGKNGDLNPSELTPNSKNKVWWRCKNGHEWYQAINKRCAGKGCRKCRENIRKNKEA